ncbi:hypothetical protein FH972_018156 [Carpinus fangiana]|uniref:Uncharacterized protein n=1 Tax=Carpinus fangiana TaxID=176857 RepID=A0A5N6RPH7_9ROSI|nr:hypothetical protein FH972_018156 [Carpinus fangiana]
MLDYMFELITQAASNHLFIFCFCNLIIAIVLVGSKPTSKIGHAAEIPISLVINTRTNRNPGADSKQLFYDKETLRNVNQVSCSQEAPVDDGREENGNGSNKNEDEDDDDDDDDDELRRKVEEFIEKVNKGWKAEILR